MYQPARPFGPLPKDTGLHVQQSTEHGGHEQSRHGAQREPARQSAEHRHNKHALARQQISTTAKLITS